MKFIALLVRLLENCSFAVGKRKVILDHICSGLKNGLLLLYYAYVKYPCIKATSLYRQSFTANFVNYAGILNSQMRRAFNQIPRWGGAFPSKVHLVFLFLFWLMRTLWSPQGVRLSFSSAFTWSHLCVWSLSLPDYCGNPLLFFLASSPALSH